MKFRVTVKITAEANGWEEEKEGIVEVESTKALHNSVCAMTKSMIHNVLEEIEKEYPED